MTVSESPRATHWSNSFNMLADVVQPTWLHCVSTWLQPHMHMNLPPICFARSGCCACAREERSAPEDTLSAMTREKAATRRLVMPLPKRHGGRKRLRLLPRGSLGGAGQTQHGTTVRQQRNQRAQHHHQAAKPNPLHQWIQERVNHGSLRFWILPRVYHVQIFAQRGIDCHHGSGLLVGLEEAPLWVQHH